MTKKAELAEPKYNRIRAVSLTGPAPILKGEDLAAYNLLLARFCKDLKPSDVIEELWLQDITILTWEILRWRRMKVCVIEAAMPAALAFVLAAPIHMRLDDIGVRKDSEKSAQPRSWPKALPPAATTYSELRSEKRLAENDLLERLSAGDRTAIKQIMELVDEFKLVDDTANNLSVLRGV